MRWNAGHLLVEPSVCGENEARNAANEEIIDAIESPAGGDED